MCKPDVHTWSGDDERFQRPVYCQEYVQRLEEELARVTADSSAPARVLESCVPGWPGDPTRAEYQPVEWDVLKGAYLVTLPLPDQMEMDRIRTELLEGFLDKGVAVLPMGHDLEVTVDWRGDPSQGVEMFDGRIPIAGLEFEYVKEAGTPSHTWFCITCGEPRPPDPAITCPREGCNMKAYSSRPPENPVLPNLPSNRNKEW